MVGETLGWKELALFVGCRGRSCSSALSDKRPPARRPGQFVGCVSVGIARKLRFTRRQEKSPRAHSRAVRDSKARIKRKNREGQRATTQPDGDAAHTSR